MSSYSINKLFTETYSSWLLYESTNVLKLSLACYLTSFFTIFFLLINVLYFLLTVVITKKYKSYCRTLNSYNDVLRNESRNWNTPVTTEPKTSKHLI